MPKTTTPAPPADAVAKDAHWAAKLARLQNRQRPTATLTICDNAAVRQALAEARQRHQRATQNLERSPDEPVLQAALAAAQANLAAAQEVFDDEAIVLTFRALPRLEFEALKAAHPPTEEGAEDGQIVNVESLGPELIAATSVDGLTPADARSFLDTWAEAEAVALFNTAWDLHSEVRMDLGKG
ncbi:hypothetical protein ACF06X_33350 [Streptomyces sp. NPDC015346]|uniref:hypothetical protein n=1 Tax=Streptomyces sp. NPDC015346 TaxID=3364954 RepID=UPI0036FDE4E5